MDMPALFFGSRGARATTLALAMVFLGPLAAWAAKLTPNSPEVREAVYNGIRFLEAPVAGDPVKQQKTEPQDPSESSEGSADTAGRSIGTMSLVGLALLKNGATAEHPKIVRAVEAIRARVRQQEAKSIGMDERNFVYSAGLAIIFLVTLDSSKYAVEIDILLAYLQAVQKPHGGWGYADRDTGDTSMTQYAVLSAWEATQAGFRLSPQSIENVANWLIKTQDPGGGFGYQGIVSETGRVKQGKSIRPSLAAAGLGSVYICANLLGMSEKIDRDEDLPLVLKEVRAKSGRVTGSGKGRVDFRKLRDAQSDGNSWIRANFEVDPPQWTYYYLYALERYYAFREAAEGERDERWYSDVARFLIRSQSEDGSWQHKNCTAPVNTAFAILFLLRSSKKSIERAHYYGAGVLVSGRGLPQDTSHVDLRAGRLVARLTAESLPRALVALEDPVHAEHASAAEMLANIAPYEGQRLLSGHEQRLVELVETGSPMARRAAVLGLAASGNLDQVPVLILALDDPEPAVVRAAAEGLQQLSRTLGPVEVSGQPSAAERRSLIEKWKAWYINLRPDAQFRN